MSRRKIKMIKAFEVGSNPDEIAFLARELNARLASLQDNGWEIIRVDSVNNTRAWSLKQQKYVATQEYIIIAQK